MIGRSRQMSNLDSKAEAYGSCKQSTCLQTAQTCTQGAQGGDTSTQNVDKAQTVFHPLVVVVIVQAYPCVDVAVISTAERCSQKRCVERFPSIPSQPIPVLELDIRGATCISDAVFS